MGMLRSSSFSRRPRAKSCEETCSTAAKENVLSKIVRSASFSRGRARSGTLKKASEEPPTSGTASEESSRGSSPGAEPKSASALPHYSPNRPLGVLHGWLKKRHAHDRSVVSLSSQWAKRYFVVDDTRGTLSYLKAEYSKKASVVLPLVDITSVRRAAPHLPAHSPTAPPALATAPPHSFGRLTS